MKRTISVIAVLILIVGLGNVLHQATSQQLSGHVDAVKLIQAAKVYAEIRKEQGLPVPNSVNLRELISSGLLTEADVLGFNGIQVDISIPNAEIGPQQVMVRARMADGYELVALGDGSVQSRN
jgi:hypothetical protein